MEASICKLFGLPLEIIISDANVGDKGYSRLYCTGDKLFQSRIINIPLKCIWKPNRYSNNVVAMDAKVVVAADNIFRFHYDTPGHTGYEDGREVCHQVDRNFPPTLKELKIMCKYWQWNLMNPNLPVLVSLDVTFNYSRIEDCLKRREVLKDFPGFPPTLEKLKIDDRDCDLLDDLPPNIRELSLFSHGTGGSVKYSPDFSSSHLEVFESERENSIILPSCIVKIIDRNRILTESFPLLEYADVRDIEGIYPSLATKIVHEPVYPGRLFW